ncbi:MAG: hypothetical protein AAF577_06905 [Pseudomonadota bacterium]
MAASPSLALADEPTALSIIVDRGASDITYYLQMPAEGIVPLLDADPAKVFSDDGAVPIVAFRSAGSFVLADALFSGIEAQASSSDVSFSSMSLMLHPASERLPFETPIEGIIAISVCNVDYGFDALMPADLTLYHGAFADGVAADDAVTLSFPATGRAPVEVTLRHYQDGRFITEETTTLRDGGTLTLAPQQATTLAMPPMAFAALGLTLLLIGGYRATHRETLGSA